MFASMTPLLSTPTAFLSPEAPRTKTRSSPEAAMSTSFPAAKPTVPLALMRPSLTACTDQEDITPGSSDLAQVDHRRFRFALEMQISAVPKVVIIDVQGGGHEAPDIDGPGTPDDHAIGVDEENPAVGFERPPTGTLGLPADPALQRRRRDRSAE